MFKVPGLGLFYKCIIKASVMSYEGSTRVLSGFGMLSAYPVARQFKVHIRWIYASWCTPSSCRPILNGKPETPNLETLKLQTPTPQPQSPATQGNHKLSIPGILETLQPELFSLSETTKPESLVFDLKPQTHLFRSLSLCYGDSRPQPARVQTNKS